MQGRTGGFAVLVVAIAVASRPVAVHAQVPGLPSGAGAGAIPPGIGGLGGAGSAGASGLPAAAGAAPPKTLWSCLGLSGANLQACQAKFCASQFGQMLNGMVGGPVGGLTGGFLPQICPAAPNAAQIAGLQQQPGGAAAAAAQIQASEANAKARVAAVEYLGTVDCSRWPEARKALIYSLREDPNECVRLAAARALNSGCCCNKEVIEALRVCVSGEAKGNAPPETSPRVKAAAFCALQNCLLRVPEDLPSEVPPEGSPVPAPGALPVPPERSARTPSEATHLAVRYTPPGRKPPSLDESSRRKTFSQTVDDARRTMFTVAATPRPPAGLPTGKRSLFNAFSKARQDVADANLRRNREPAGARSGSPIARPPVESGSPASAPPAREDSGPVDDAGAAASPPDEDPASATSADHPSNARRGLIGVLFPSRDH